MNRYVLTIYDPEQDEPKDRVKSYVFDNKKKGIQFLNKKYHEIYDEWKSSEDPEYEIYYIDEKLTVPPDVDERNPVINFYGGAAIDFFFVKETIEDIKS